MTDKKSILPLFGARFYHIFNRGNNYEKIFFNDENYYFFLRRFRYYLNDYLDTYSYCLLPNHFHLLVRIKDSIFSKDGILKTANDNKIGKLTGQQLRRFFISYSMAINKQENRSGSLFLKNFKRIEIDDEKYLRYMLFYIHYNPQKHNLINDFRQYNFSSYKSILSSADTKLKRNDILNNLFNDKQEFIEFHNYYHSENQFAKYIFED
jgi:putative transposase